jgi:uncharacterized protein
MLSFLRIATFVTMGFYLIIILVLFLLDIYVFQAVKTVFTTTEKTAWPWLIYWGLCAFAYLTFLLYAVLGKDNFYGYPRLIMLGIAQSFLILKMVVLPFLLTSEIIRAYEWLLRWWPGSEQHDANAAILRSRFLNRIGLAAGGMFFGAFIYGVLRGAYQQKIFRPVVYIQDLPDALVGLKIAQVSDLHLGSFASVAPIRKAVECINAEQPDLFFFTGDFVNNKAHEALAFKEILSEIKARYGCYSILGNHDYGDYVTWNSQREKEDNLESLKSLQRALGWELLLDEHKTLDINGAQVAVMGVEYWGRSMGFGQKGKIEKAHAGTASAAVRLLLSHDPSHWNYVISEDPRFADIDITFAGHTHGFQFGIEIPGFKWSPSQWVYPQWAGLYQKKRQYLYVNRGLGFLGYPGRVGIPPEITIMTLAKA